MGFLELLRFNELYYNVVFKFISLVFLENLLSRKC